MQTVLKRFIVGFLFFIFQAVAFADSTDATLNQMLKNIHSMQANFTQTVTDSKGKAIQISQGTMALLRPGQFRWQVIKPNAQLIIAKGQRLWVYDPDLQQVTIRSLKGEAGETPALLLSDANPALEKDFNVHQDNDPTGGLQWYMLIPKNKGSVITSMHIGFASNQIRRMELKDHLGHTTIIQFQNIRTNGALSASLFTFVKPKNVDVINENK